MEASFTSKSVSPSPSSLLPSLPTLSYSLSPFTVSSFPFRQAIGYLIFLMTGTRPDLAFAVGWLAQFQESPSPAHWSSVKRIFCYLAATPHLGLLYSGTSILELRGYSDRDWSGFFTTRRSTSGYVFFLAGAAVSWR